MGITEELIGWGETRNGHRYSKLFGINNFIHGVEDGGDTANSAGIGQLES